MKNLSLTFITCFLIVFASCKKEDQATIRLDATTLTLKVGQVHQFVAYNGDNRYTAEEFSWGSSDASIGNVNGSGQFHSGKEGKVTVTATHYKDKSVVLTCAVTVTR